MNERATASNGMEPPEPSKAGPMSQNPASTQPEPLPGLSCEWCGGALQPRNQNGVSVRFCTARCSGRWHTQERKRLVALARQVERSAVQGRPSSEGLAALNEADDLEAIQKYLALDVATALPLERLETLRRHLLTRLEALDAIVGEVRGYRVTRGVQSHKQIDWSRLPRWLARSLTPYCRTTLVETVVISYPEKLEEELEGVRAEVRARLSADLDR